MQFTLAMKNNHYMNYNAVLKKKIGDIPFLSIFLNFATLFLVLKHRSLKLQSPEFNLTSLLVHITELLTKSGQALCYIRKFSELYLL